MLQLQAELEKIELRKKQLKAAMERKAKSLESKANVFFSFLTVVFFSPILGFCCTYKA